MQIVNVNVDTCGPELVVSFAGGRGEGVHVRMAKRPREDDAVTMARVRALVLKAGSLGDAGRTGSL